MERLVNSLKCGAVHVHSENSVLYQISKFEDIYSNIIPLFNKYPIKGVKTLDFKDLVKAAELIKVKGHLTNEGLERIRLIKLKMNAGRIY